MALSDISFKDSKVQKIAGGLVILIIMAAGWFTQLYSPNQSLINEKREKLEQLNLKLQSARLQAGKLAEIEEELEEAFMKYKLLEKLLPTERNVPDFINKINVAARQNNIKVSRMDLDPSEIQEFFTADPYRMDISGSYHDFGSFLSDVANLSFIATSKNIQLTKSGPGNIKASITIISYHLSEGERLEGPTAAMQDREPAADEPERVTPEMMEAHSP